MQNIVKPHPQIDKYEKSGIYKMKSMNCPLKHTGQTGRTCHTKYKEYVQAIRNDNGNSRCWNHI
jgi:hypothetical protein